MFVIIFAFFFHFPCSHLSLLFNAYGNFSLKDSSENTSLKIFKFGTTIVYYDQLYCLRENQPQFTNHTMVSDGYDRGYVSFAHCLLYFQIICIFMNINENIRNERTNGEKKCRKIMDVPTKLLISQLPIALEYKT